MDGSLPKKPRLTLLFSSLSIIQILLEKEFDDFYEDQVHKAAGPVVFVSKTLGMLPAIWTEDENESECKSYFNLYTFVLFIGEDDSIFDTLWHYLC